MNKIKLIALDLDGTTLRSRDVLSDKNKDALELAIRQGTHVVVATGRTFSSLPECIFKIQGLEYIITSNGAHITNLQEMKNIYSNYASENAIESVHEILSDKKEYIIEVFTNGRAYIDKESFDDISKNGSGYMNADYVIKTRNPIENIYDFLIENKSFIENINIHFEHFEDKAFMKDILSKLDGITVTSSMPHNLEIGGETTSKANAIKNLCRILNIEEENVMAVGDSPNDMAMIEAAGIGVAVANAEDEVKSIADYITLSNEDDGVAFAVNKFVLEKN